MAEKVYLNLEKRRRVTLCNHNFSREGILHPDRVMEEYDLLFMQNGEWDIIEDGQEYHLIPGSVLLLEPGKHHYSVKKCSPMMRNVYIHFTAEDGDGQPAAAGLSETAVFPESRLAREKAQAPEPSCTRILTLPKLVHTAEHKEIRHAFEQVIDAYWSSDTDSKSLRCSLCLEHLLLQLSDLGTLDSRGRTDILISEIIHRFHVEPDVFLSPEELAESYGVSVRTVSGRFKERTGMSVHQYQLQLKLEMAYDLLPLSPGRSLHDIALSFGFYDEFQFSKLFKRRFGISPSERR